jgi:hypothetical protein
MMAYAMHDNWYGQTPGSDGWVATGKIVLSGDTTMTSHQNLGGDGVLFRLDIFAAVGQNAINRRNQKYMKHKSTSIEVNDARNHVFVMRHQLVLVISQQ